MAVKGLTEETSEEKPDFAQLQKDAAARLESQNEERDEARKARQVRLGHVEAPKPKSKAKAKDSEEESE